MTEIKTDNAVSLRHWIGEDDMLLAQLLEFTLDRNRAVSFRDDVVSATAEYQQELGTLPSNPFYVIFKYDKSL